MEKQKVPREIRAQILRDILRVVAADAALFFSVSDIDGRAVISDAQVEGDSQADRLIDVLPGRRDFVDLARLQDPHPLDSRTFQEGATLPRSFATALASLGVADRIRLFVYDERRFVGWIGALRFAPSATPFSRNDRRKLSALVEPTTAALLEADAIARRSLPVQTGFVIMHAGGDVEYASREGQAWLRRPGFALALQRRIAFVDGEGAAAVELARCQFVPMIGAHPLFLVQLSEARSVEKSAVALSPTQREVANFAASGATVAEIASAIGRKPETVRSHLREAYNRLGVSNRVELARALAA